MRKQSSKNYLIKFLCKIKKKNLVLIFFKWFF